MNILALDCATGPCSVAVWKDGRIAAYIEELQPVVQSARLLPMIEEALKQSGISYRDLSAVAATIGPGSFTGIRVALAAARGICFSAGIQGLGYTTLDVLHFAARKEAKKKPVLALLNAGKGEYYYQLAGGAPQLGRLEEALVAAGKNIFIAGNAPESRGCPFPRADALAELAASGAPAQALHPFYIRPPDAKLPAQKV